MLRRANFAGLTAILHGAPKMREHYMRVGAQVAATQSFFENENAGRAFKEARSIPAGLLKRILVSFLPRRQS